MQAGPSISSSLSSGSLNQTSPSQLAPVPTCETNLDSRNYQVQIWFIFVLIIGMVLWSLTWWKDRKTIGACDQNVALQQVVVWLGVN